MPEPTVDSLRTQLRDRGYLSHGIERWFALDPWSSRAFWTELAVVALKAATLVALFASLAHVAVMTARNGRLGVFETLILFLLYGAVWLAGAFAFIVSVALVLKGRPELAVDTPRALLAISIAAAAALVLPLAGWWLGFETQPSAAELATGGVLGALFFIEAAIVVSAALLSFSIYELKRIPVIHQRSRTIPLTIAAAVLIALLFVPARGGGEPGPSAPPQIVTMPTDIRVALVAVDGLTWEIARSRPDLLGLFTSSAPASPIPGASAAERWASLGTGVAARHHGVRALAGIELAGGGRLLQSVSRRDFVLRRIAPAVRLGHLRPLPPAVRRRHFVWESFAARGVPSVAVNWWTAGSEAGGALTSIGQETIFGSSRGEPLRVDDTAIRRLEASVGASKPRFATVYLPALDVILNRLPADRSQQLAMSLRAIDGVAEAVRGLRGQAYEVLLAGLPGEGQSGSAVIASTVPLKRPSSAWDVAPTLAALLGFPASGEMPGQPLATGEALPRIATYGERGSAAGRINLNEEYFESLKSLGYIR